VNNPQAKAAGYFFPEALNAGIHRRAGKNNRILHRMIRVFQGVARYTPLGITEVIPFSQDSKLQFGLSTFK
jgi:hypothetical protein